jgi:predicted nucleic acid-binding protein
MIVFIDTFALIAWLNPRDDAHAHVTAYLDSFTGRLVTTEWVLMELADALSAPAARSTAVRFLQAVRADPSFEIVGYDPAVYRAGFDLFAGRPDKAWPLTDCISFAVMTQRGLSEALTADHHFEQAGFGRYSNNTPRRALETERDDALDMSVLGRDRLP